MTALLIGSLLIASAPKTRANIQQHVLVAFLTTIVSVGATYYYSANDDAWEIIVDHPSVAFPEPPRITIGDSWQQTWSWGFIQIRTVSKILRSGDREFGYTINYGSDPDRPWDCEALVVESSTGRRFWHQDLGGAAPGNYSVDEGIKRSHLVDDFVLAGQTYRDILKENPNDQHAQDYLDGLGCKADNPLFMNSLRVNATYGFNLAVSQHDLFMNIRFDSTAPSFTVRMLAEVQNVVEHTFRRPFSGNYEQKMSLGANQPYHDDVTASWHDSGPYLFSNFPFQTRANVTPHAEGVLIKYVPEGGVEFLDSGGIRIHTEYKYSAPTD